MGNYASCGHIAKQSKLAKLILPSGEINHFDHPVRVAELMIDIPNHFVVNSKSLKVGRRFSALNTDNLLEIANVYVMFPMKRVNSFVTAADVLVAKRGGAVKKGGVAPACSGEVEWPTIELPADVKSELCSPGFKQLVLVCRSKKPSLETILEEPLCSW